MLHWYSQMSHRICLVLSARGKVWGYTSDTWLLMLIWFCCIYLFPGTLAIISVQISSKRTIWYWYTSKPNLRLTFCRTWQQSRPWLHPLSALYEEFADEGCWSPLHHNLQFPASLWRWQTSNKVVTSPPDCLAKPIFIFYFFNLTCMPVCCIKCLYIAHCPLKCWVYSL